MSAFNLSTLVAMRDEHLEQASAHFWRCQLTEASPRHSWDPRGGSWKAGKAKGGDKEGASDDDEDDDEDADVTIRHLLQVTGCVLTPQASGVHLITVRTSCYQKQQEKPTDKQPEPAACPIVCIDPSAQRTLALGHEFVPAVGPSSAGAVVFELAEGTGPVWLTGTHRVQRVTRLAAPWFGDHGEEDANGDDVEEDEEAEDDAADSAADVEEADDDDEEAEVEDDEEEELAEEAKRPAVVSKGKGKGQQQQQQQQRRKRAKPDS